MLEIEISRDRVPIRNAYKHVGQQASVRVNSGVDRSLSGVVSSTDMPSYMFEQHCMNHDAGQSSSIFSVQLQAAETSRCHLLLCISLHVKPACGDQIAVPHGCGPLHNSGKDYFSASLELDSHEYMHPTQLCHAKARITASGRTVLELNTPFVMQFAVRHSPC